MILNITVKVRKKNANLYDYSIVAEKVKTEIDYFRNVHKHKDLEWLQTNMRKKNKQKQLQSETSFILMLQHSHSLTRMLDYHKPNSLKTVPLIESWITGHPV